MIDPEEEKKIINTILQPLTSFLKKINKLSEYNELGGLYVRLNFYLSKELYYNIRLFEMENDLCEFYEKYVMEEMNCLQIEDNKSVFE